jgi:dihydrolipoamide dehydrogenase
VGGDTFERVISTAEQFDLVVIGGGPGGYAAALYATAAGLRCAIVERDKVGGTCLHRGCIPAKEFLETASVFRTVQEAQRFGVIVGAPTMDFAISQARKQTVVDELWKGLSGLLKKKKITVFNGNGTLLPGNSVRITGGTVNEPEVTEIVGTNVILAAGSVPRTIPGFEPDGQTVFTSDEFLELSIMPETAVVIGAGAIGCEFASTMSDLGTKVTILEAMPKMLPGCDVDVVDVVAKSFKKRAIDVRLGVGVTGHTPTAGGFGTTVHFGDGESINVDMVVVSVGRLPRSSGLLADGTGVVITDRGFVQVDPYMRTTAPGVYAVGDIVPTPALAHIGYAEAIVAVKTILGEHVVPIAYDRVPWCIYCHPEVSFAGLSEEQATAAGHDVVVKKERFIGNGRAKILGETDGLVKIIAKKTADGRAGQILGVHMAGPWVTEQLGQAYLAVNWEATVDEVAQFIQPHPSLSETFGEAMLALTGRGLNG